MMFENQSQTEQRPVKKTVWSTIKRNPHWKSLLLTVLIIGCLSAIIWCRMSAIARMLSPDYWYNYHDVNPCDDGYVYIPIAFLIMLYLVYLVECWHCHARLELDYSTDTASVYERVQTMKAATPLIWWKAACYHYVRRSRQVTRYRNGDSFSSIQVYYERVNTHTESSAFDYSLAGVKDISKSLKGLEDYPIVKIKFTKGFSFACVDAEREFEEQRCTFFSDNEGADDFMETQEGLELRNCDFKNFLIAFTDFDRIPWYAKRWAFWLASLMLMSWPLRLFVEYKTAEVHYIVHKVFGLNYISDYIPRVNTMDSAELEFNIKSNITLVPSYSEAILMECASHRPRWSTIDINGNFTPLMSPTNPARIGFYPYGTFANQNCACNKNTAASKIVPRHVNIHYVTTRSDSDLTKKADDVLGSNIRCATHDQRKNKRIKGRRFVHGKLVPRSQSAMTTFGVMATSPENYDSCLSSGGMTPEPPSYETAIDSETKCVASGRLPKVHRDQQSLSSSRSHTDKLSHSHTNDSFIDDGFQESPSSHIAEPSSSSNSFSNSDGRLPRLSSSVLPSRTRQTPDSSIVLNYGSQHKVYQQDELIRITKDGLE